MRQIRAGPSSGLQRWSLPADCQSLKRVEEMSPRQVSSSVIASASAQQAGHQVTMVLPLQTTSRLSVSVVIFVVFTTAARSDRPIAAATVSIVNILYEPGRKSPQRVVQYLSKSFNMSLNASFKAGFGAHFETTNKRG